MLATKQDDDALSQLSQDSFAFEKQMQALEYKMKHKIGSLDTATKLHSYS